MTNPFDAVRSTVLDLDLDRDPGSDPEADEQGGARKKFAHMPIGESVDMGHAEDGTPLIDPRIFDSSEFSRHSNRWSLWRN